MNEIGQSGDPGANGRRITAMAAALVILLALAALLWPGGDRGDRRATLLVFDSSGDGSRRSEVYDPLEAFLTRTSGRYLDLEIVADVASFRERVGEGAAFVFCPDGLGLELDPDRYIPVAVGRRSAPRNLRPRGVLVYRKSAGLITEPWRVKPAATVIGDSLSLAATGAWRKRNEKSVPPATAICAWGPDPYDHAPALHAARLGAFDYALVRQWDAERFFAGGLLSAVDWGIEIMTVPVPDIVLLASRDLPADVRLAAGQAAASLGRGEGGEAPEALDLRNALLALHLSGFNLLIDPDFDLVRGNFTAGWPPDAD